ncbi:hypothetical protein ABH935_006446 [Catenulispora sp. GAS73]|uniref:DUF742 domain-containing protein n=1 Tax=Catenulispora sp. GAS73 TaxID=3156269 RepID=UPI003517E6D3
MEHVGRAWTDDAELGRLRLYTLTGGRTTPTRPLDLASLVHANSADPPQLDGELEQIHVLCRSETRSIAELAGLLRQPATVIKILVADLLDLGALAHATPSFTADPTDIRILEQVLAGLRELKV